MIRGRRRATDLDGNAPDTSPTVLLIIDAINDFNFEGAGLVLAGARPMAERIRRLKRLARRAGIPAVYVNDNFGRWRSDFRKVVAHCGSASARGREVTRRLRPDALDYFVLKPRHSGFFSTTLELLLEHFEARTLILTGLLTDICVLFTAQDAYMRGYALTVPPDCVVGRTPADHAWALVHMRRTLKADTRSSTALDLGGGAGARSARRLARSRRAS